MITLYTHYIILSTLIFMKRQKKGCRKEKKLKTHGNPHSIGGTMSLVHIHYVSIIFQLSSFSLQLKKNALRGTHCEEVCKAEMIVIVVNS